MLVTLGNVALRAVLGRDASIGACHGTLTQAEIEHDGKQASLPLFPLYHPASIIYNRALQSVYQDDLTRLRTLLDI